MKACMITNGFLTNGKFSEITQWLVEAGKRKGIELEVRTNDSCLVELGSHSTEGKLALSEEILHNPEFVLFWDKDIRLANYLEHQGIRLFNCASAIEYCDDKSLTHMMLQQADVPMPKTILAPKTFEGIGYPNMEFLQKVVGELGFPMVVKECFGSFGQQVYLVHNKQECEQLVKKLEGKAFLFQKFVKTSFARDIRLQVVGDQVVASMYRYSENGDFRANISNGGKMKPYEPTQEQKELAVKCCKVLGLDFAGVDLLFAEDDRPIVCEVNSNAHFKNIYDCTGINAGDHIMDHILKSL